jgi:hypothetical protein
MALKAVTGSIHPELNEQFFGPTGRTAGPILRTPQSSNSIVPQGVPTGTQTPNASTVNPGAATPAQQPVSPK